MDQLARNEQLKLTANALDRASTALVTFGVLAPLAAAIYTTSPPPGIIVFVASAAIWLLCSIALHLGARFILRGLR